jgi:adenylyl- and sulfurtransferase ThiI
LKSEPVRRIYESILVRNIKLALKREGVEFTIRRKRGRIFINGDVEKVKEALKNVFGIVSFSPCYHIFNNNCSEPIRM